MALPARLLRPRASGGGFDPKSIANCALWLDASNGSTLTFNGGDVSEWRDLSGNGRHFSQSTAINQPAGTNRTLNGLRVLDFTPSKHLINSGANANNLFRNVSGGTVVMVTKFDQTARNGVVFIASRNDNRAISRFSIGQNTVVGGTYVGGRRLDADSFANANYTDNTNVRVQTGVLDYANSDAFIYENGELKASNTSFQTDGNTSDTDSNGITIGSDIGTPQAHDGFIAELIAYQRALSNVERVAVERYLGAKWGITVA